MRSPEPMIIYHDTLALASQELESLNHDPRLPLIIEDNAVEHATFFTYGEDGAPPFVLDGSALPTALTDALYVPSRISVSSMEARLSELPATKTIPLTWSLTTKLAYKDAGARAIESPDSYISLVTTEQQTTITADGPDGQPITKILDPSVGGELLYAMLAFASGRNAKRPSLPVTKNVTLLSEALTMLGAKLGNTEKTSVAHIMDAAAGSRSLVIVSTENNGVRTSSEGVTYSYLMEIGDTSDNYTLMESSHYEVISTEDIAVKSLVDHKGQRYQTNIHPDDHALAFQTGMQGREKAKDFSSKIRREDYDLISTCIMSTLRPALITYDTESLAKPDRSDNPINPDQI